MNKILELHKLLFYKITLKFRTKHQNKFSTFVISLICIIFIQTLFSAYTKNYSHKLNHKKFKSKITNFEVKKVSI